MKYIFNFTKFINEALRDEISDHHKDVLTNNIFKYKPEEDTDSAEIEDIVPDDVLNSDIPKKAENILEGVWKLTEEDKDKAIKIMFGVDVPKVEELLGKFNPPQNFLNILKQSSLVDIDILKPSIKDIKNIYGNNFRLLSVNETKSDKKHSRDTKGVPLKDSDGNFIMIKKEIGEPVFTENKSNFNTLVTSYFNCGYEQFFNPYTFDTFTKINTKILDINRNNFDIDILSNFDLELYISSKPGDMLNMSLSAFYDSCQNLYTGGFRHQIPANLFDKNVKICYLRFNTPFIDNVGNTIPFTSFSRCLIRNIKGKLYFETTYPKTITEIQIFHHNMITKYTGMVNDYKGDKYYHKKTVKGIPGPYIDSLSLETVEDDSNDPKAIALSKALNLDIDSINKVRFCEYVYRDEVERDFYVFDLTKSDDDFENEVVTVMDRMLSKLRTHFVEMYPFDKWEHYVDIDKLKAKEPVITDKATALYGYDDEDDVDTEDIYKLLKKTNSPAKMSKFFSNYMDRKFYDTILNDWKSQMVRVLSRDNKVVKYDKYVIIEK